MMRNARSLRVSFVVSVLLAGSLFSASAAELQPPPPPHKPTVAAMHAKKPVRHRLIRIASVQWLPRSGCGLGCPFPLVLGVAY
jgi:hypothetical protein